MSERVCTSCVVHHPEGQPHHSDLQSRLAQGERDRLARAEAIGRMALRYYAKTAISARAVEALEKIEAALAQPAAPSARVAVKK